MTRVVIALRDLEVMQTFRFSKPNLLLITFDPERADSETIRRIIVQAGGFTVTQPD